MPARLEPLQRFLSGALRRADPLPGDPAAAAACAEHVAGNDRLSPAEQADIYRRQYWSRHVDSLADDYPGLRHVLGEDAFDAFCRAYLAEHPPRSYTLRDLGDRIVPFAERYANEEGRFPPELRAIALDMVRYENALVDVFDGAEPPPLDPRKVHEMPEDGWSTARIVLHPLLVRMRLGHPVHDVRAAVRRGQAPELPAPRPVCLAVFRKDLLIRFEEVEPRALDLLDALARGEPLTAACDAIAAGLDEAEAAALSERVQAWFAQWTAWGLLVDVIAPPAG